VLQTGTDDSRWEAVLGRDSGQDGVFVYGVSSTRIYCRPSCPSRRPLPIRVRFFDHPGAAEKAGYRACLRCRPKDPQRAGLRQVEAAREYIDSHPEENVTLNRLARVARVSPYHLQRTFKRVVGLSPKAYATARRMEQMKARLRRGDSVSRATYDSGFGSASRLYEQARTGLGMTPGAYQRGGQGVTIRFALVSTPLGQALAAATERGLCAVMLGDDASELEQQLRAEYPAATLERNEGELRDYTDAVLNWLAGDEGQDLRLDLGGTSFQLQVWEALRRIPRGETRSYQSIARELGRPAAARAVAGACASNRLALVIPCHRAVRESGEAGGYRWGSERKRQILEQERGQRDSRREATVPA
jgi:AraC family transcriptional regulator, regulatory protein of adaptative response / methylated-DNA-[protein]-cysteine methyltransferase